MTIVGTISFVVGCTAAVEDLARRRISNWTSGAAVVSGFVVHASRAGWRGAVSAGTGALVGFAVFLIFYLLNGMGAGDVKLMAGFGSLLGPSVILGAAWLAAAVGGMMALVYASVLALRARRCARPANGEPAPVEMIPYAPAIVAGAWLAEFALG
ncbi:MAG: prepilin peptidase [Acidobacteriia bacterium]|nr:prepilin peptidase [Terriglobia bacterium]